MRAHCDPAIEPSNTCKTALSVFEVSKRQVEKQSIFSLISTRFKVAVPGDDIVT
jgi:hypothetical protein